MILGRRDEWRKCVIRLHPTDEEEATPAERVGRGIASHTDRCLECGQSRKNPSKVIYGGGHSKLGQRLCRGLLNVHEFDKWAASWWLSAKQTSAFARGISVRRWREADRGICQAFGR